MNRKRTVGAALAAVLLVGGLTACGGGGGDADAAGKGAKEAGAAAEAKAKAQTPVEAVKAAYLKTAAAKSAKAELTIVGSDGKTSGQSGTKGWYPSGHDVTLKSDKPDARSVMLGDLVYTQLDAPLQGKPWMKMNLAKDGKPGVRLNDDPAEYLAMLLGQGKLAHVGAGQTDGIDAEHYKATLTGADLLAADESTKVMQEQDRTYLHEAVKHLTAWEVDLWIGKDGYPVRVDTVSTDAKGTRKATAKFSGFGAQAPVQAPPAEQVADLDAVLKGVDDSLAETDRKLVETDKTLKEADKTLRDAGLGGLGGS
ncbi:hypothetical protein AB0D54_30925 [Streptomyces xanthophaeus]|uniref:hypothetical protein n=1 Tax=Streptomyces xanthophaeus TaxID=67385 RepID=UPI00344A4591